MRALGSKKWHWHVQATTLPSEEGNQLLLQLSRLGTSDLSLFAMSDFDSAFARQNRLRRQLLQSPTDLPQRRPDSRRQRPLTCAAKVRFVDNDEEENDEGECQAGRRPQSHAGDELLLESASLEDDFDDFNTSVSDTEATIRLPESSSALDDATASGERDPRRQRSLLTLQLITGFGDAKHELSASFCDTNWRHCAGDFCRARSAPYPQNIRLHPVLADAVRHRIVAGRRLFETVSFGGLCDIDFRSPSLAKTRHDRIIEWLQDTSIQCS